jgi:hypothetical protein
MTRVETSSPSPREAARASGGVGASRGETATLSF